MRSTKTALVIAAAVVTSTVMYAPAAHAAGLNGTIGLSSPVNGKIAAATAKQVILLTVTGQTLSEAMVTSVDLGSDPACAGITSYVVTSPTTIALKTPPGGCAVTPASPTAGDNIVINFAGGNTLTRTGGLFFVSPPAIAGLVDKPVINDNSSLLQAANQNQRFVAGGGQVVRVKADAAFAFDPRTTAGLAVTFAGKPGTEVKVYGTDNALIPPTTQTPPVVGNSLTFKTAPGLNPADSSITITQGGVGKTFTAAETGATVVTAPSVTGLTVTSGKAKGATSTVVNGSGFSKVFADYGATGWKVLFCGVPGTVTAVNALGTQITVTTPDVTDDDPGLGTGNFSGPCQVEVYDTANTAGSPLTPTTIFTFLAE